MAQKRYAVIGAGPAGTAAIKCLKEEGMEPVCFERTGHIGGLWRYHDDDVDGLASVMKSTVINNSKEMGALSDFPPKKEYPNYMHNKHVHEYLRNYGKTFDTERHIRLNKEIIEVMLTCDALLYHHWSTSLYHVRYFISQKDVRIQIVFFYEGGKKAQLCPCAFKNGGIFIVQVGMADDYDETGRLYVVAKDTKTGVETREVFDGVFVCVGHHVYPNMPSFPGMEKFKGTVLHTHSLKKVQQFEDQNVVVVGVGNSGMDAAVEISSVAKQVYISSRRGAWVLPRVGPWGFPIDTQLQRRWLDVLFKKLPYSFICWFCELMLNQRFDHSLYNLKPEHRVWSQHATVSDALPHKLLSGTVAVRKNIKEFVENGVVFEGEEKVTECDSVVFATGYKIKFPFLHESLTRVKENEVHLYKYMYPPHLKHPTLAIIGLVQVTGAGFPAGEAQSRLACLVMNGKLKLPSREAMEADIRKTKDFNSKRYSKSLRHTIQADYILYLDELYSLMGARPNFFKMFFTDPVLFWTLFFGPSVPYQYRLQGPHAWPGARQAILDTSKRIVQPLRSGYQVTNPIVVFEILLFVIFIALIGCVIKIFV